MSRRFFQLVLLVVCVPLMVDAQEKLYTRVFFENSLMPDNYFFSEVSYTGKSWVKNAQSRLPVIEGQAFTPGNSLELKFASAIDGNWTATIQYQALRGVDFFRKADLLSFWIHPKTSINPDHLPKISLITADSLGLESRTIAEYVRTLTPGQWTRVTIPLRDFSSGGLAAAQINGIRFSQGAFAPSEGHLLLDQVELVPLIPASKATAIEQTPVIRSVRGYEKHFDISWEPVNDESIRYVKIYRSTREGQMEAVGIQSPWISGYADFMGSANGEVSYTIAFVGEDYQETRPSNAVSGGLREMNDEAFLDMVQEAHFRYYWEGSEPHSGMALENIPGRTSMIASGASGFGIMAILCGADRGFITRQDAVSRFSKITDFLLKTERFHGVFSHFINGGTGEAVPFFGPKDNGGDLVETSFLMQGLLVARQYFDRNTPQEKRIRDSITELWSEAEWDWYRRYPDSDFLFWHWSPDQAWVIDHRLIGWNETMITYFLAIASPTHGVPASMYYSGWAGQSDEAVKYRMAWGNTEEGARYRNGNTYYGTNLPVGVSTGGPLFFVHYSYMGLDPHTLTDRYVNYFENNRRIAAINFRYCMENPEDHQGYGADFWGLTASDGPWNYSANEPKPEMDEGKMAPTGALASFPYLPDASMDALKNYYRTYGRYLYGYYGFRDAINLDENWCSPIYMGLNQAPVVVMIENYRSGLIWNLFMANPEVRSALKLIESADE